MWQICPKIKVSAYSRLTGFFKCTGNLSYEHVTYPAAATWASRRVTCRHRYRAYRHCLIRAYYSTQLNSTLFIVMRLLVYCARPLCTYARYHKGGNGGGGGRKWEG